MKIVIVGGGTAGWITATILKKYTSFSDITLIESTKLGIIGAGEGSTGTLPWLIRDEWKDGSVTEMDFLRKTKGTIKLGIKLKNWKGDGSSIYSPFHGSPTDTNSVDSATLGSILKYGRADYSSIFSWLMDENITTFRKDYSGRIVSAMQNFSYHFDGHEVGKFFSEWCTKRGVKLIDSEVNDVSFQNGEVKSIHLSNGEIIEGDLFFDCSGFSRVLMSRTDNKWVSYSEHLPTNSAIPFTLPISAKDVKFETLAETMNAGWMWKIPLQNRYGCGYVYSDKFQTYDESIKELEKKFGKIEPIKHIKFEAGRYEKIWYKNIVAVGLASHFLEPLQATSIHISIVSVANLIFHFLKNDDINLLNSEADKKSYNKFATYMMDDYKDFIQMHYLAGRNDTPFWKFVSTELEISERNKELIDIGNRRVINAFDINQSHGTPGYPLWVHILDNAGLYKKDIVESELNHYKKYNEAMDWMITMKKKIKEFKTQFVSNEEFFNYLKR
jgi:flavin-dependent dehydrogenase